MYDDKDILTLVLMIQPES